ncbi:UvrD-helicase domain-containing protein [Allopusillimonas ginsengisoli]|uniref:UvrD-helicase domain-containing protein n=1 Tax=Allopusillimonas ginsengisoli TaxID=453575 RepID=UPI0039C1A5DC
MLKQLKDLGAWYSREPENPELTQAQNDARADIEQRLKAAGKALPTEDQFRMILSDAAMTRVVAGAGSGKSTTLVLRCIYLHFYLGVPWTQMSVVTFTRNSRRDFMRKLGTTAEIWGEALSKEDLAKVVRTFHSLAFSQAKDAGLPSSTIDGLNMPASNGGDLPFPPLGIPEDGDLANMLNEVASELMRVDEKFRTCVMGMYNASFMAAGASDVDKDTEAVRNKRITAVQAHDRDRTRYMEQVWREEFAPGLMDNPLIEFKLASFVTGAVASRRGQNKANGPWWANAHIPQLGAWLLLGASPGMAHGRDMDDGFSMGWALNAKKSCVNVLTSSTPVIWINTVDDLVRLHERLKWTPEKSAEFPKFGIKLTGETSSTPLLVAFWQQAQFIQSLGLNVAHAAQQSAKKVRGLDALFVHALARFWPAFEAQLAASGLITSNGIFESLADENIVGAMPEASLDACTHLLIDEFQDISGNIVKWLVAVRAQLRQRGRKTSLMVVGDDWQSIYGWRGSSPRYFVRFNHYFGEPGNRRARTIILSDNFRSSQHIVDAAQLMLADVEEKLDKACVARSEHAELADPVQVRHFDVNKQGSLGWVDMFPTESTAFVIGRTNAAITGKNFGLAKPLTIHGAKGLEADYVVIVEDFSPPMRHPLRCSWYELADLGDYDIAQRDETHRLAYVAITRAKKGCMWLVPGTVPDGMYDVLAYSGSPAVLAEETDERK